MVDGFGSPESPLMHHLILGGLIVTAIAAASGCVLFVFLSTS